jgi:protein TonB
MPRIMFQEVVCPAGDANRKWYTLPLSLAIHTVLVAVLIVVPLVVTDALPMPRKMMNYMMAEISLAPVEAPQAVRPMPTSDGPTANVDAAPVQVPDAIGRESGIAMIEEPTTGTIQNVMEGFGVTTLVADVVPLSREPDVQPVRIGGGLKPPTRIKDVPPVYPEIARRARVQGVVVLEAIIGVDGKVQQALVLRSVPLLDDAALNAVQSWEYTPTLLAGRPIPIIMTVTVQFKLE